MLIRTKIDLTQEEVIAAIKYYLDCYTPFEVSREAKTSLEHFEDGISVVTFTEGGNENE